MARGKFARKYQITINNPLDHGYTHEKIKQLLSALTSVEYWCLCDETGENGTPHTHIYFVARNQIMFSTLQPRFYRAHIEPVNGTNQENRDYIRKEGKWQDSDKRNTNHAETFEESGELPPDRATGIKETYAIYEMVKDGASNFEIMEQYPNAMNRLDRVEQARQTILAERYKNEWRTLEVTYIYGDTGVGKTRSVVDEYGYSNVYRTTNYAHPFDSYRGQDVIMFEEFRSSLLISDMLVYLDGYPCVLPCRYTDKQACYTKVFIVTNIPLNKQYPNIQLESPETWEAFKRRINQAIAIYPTEFTDIDTDIPDEWR